MKIIHVILLSILGIALLIGLSFVFGYSDVFFPNQDIQDD